MDLELTLNGPSLALFLSWPASLELTALNVPYGDVTPPGTCFIDRLVWKMALFGRRRTLSHLLEPVGRKLSTPQPTQ